MSELVLLSLFCLWLGWLLRGVWADTREHEQSIIAQAEELARNDSNTGRSGVGDGT